MKIMSQSFITSARLSELSSAARSPTSGPPTGPKPLGQLVTDTDGDGRFTGHERLGVGIDRNELDAVNSGPDHAIDGVATSATNTNDLDAGERLGK
jgi:hypothetical protein